MPDFVVLANVRWKQEGKGGNSSQQYANAILRRGWRLSYIQRDGINVLTPLDDMVLGPDVIAMCDMPWVECYYQIFKELKARGCRTVYRIVDNWLLTPRRDQYSEEREKEFIRNADLVFASNPLSIERFRDFRPDIRLLRNGIDLDIFWNWSGEPPTNIIKGSPTALFLASFWDPEWIDWAGLIHAAESYPELAINILGASQAPFDRILPANIHFLGICSWNMLPAYLHASDVGLVAYDGYRTRYNNPIKVLEYLGSGIPAVSPVNQSIMDYPYLYTYDRSEDLGSTIMRAVSCSIDRDCLYHTLLQHTWDARLEEIVTTISNLPPTDHMTQSEQSGSPSFAVLLEQHRQFLEDSPNL